jgi:hypothetical protein
LSGLWKRQHVRCLVRRPLGRECGIFCGIRTSLPVDDKTWNNLSYTVFICVYYSSGVFGGNFLSGIVLLSGEPWLPQAPIIGPNNLITSLSRIMSLSHQMHQTPMSGFLLYRRILPVLEAQHPIPQTRSTLMQMGYFVGISCEWLGGPNILLRPTVTQITS